MSSSSYLDDVALARSVQLAEDIEYAQRLAEQDKSLFRQEQQAVRQQQQEQEWANLPNQFAAGAFENRNRNSHASSSLVPAPRGAPAASTFAEEDDNPLLQDNSLLHVACEINGRMVEMMVDTGAQGSVVSEPLMRALGLEDLLDRRSQGIASGVGQARILGRIERCPVQIGHVEFRLGFLVLEHPEHMMILGIDQMKRFKCMIDMENNKLIFGGRDGVEVDFLPSEPSRVARTRSLQGCPVS